MIKATISGDIVGSTTLSEEGQLILEKGFHDLLFFLDAKFGVYGRVVKGDYLECYLNNPENALRVMLIIKCFIKALPIKGTIGTKSFKMHGIRLAIGLGEISRFDKNKGIIDGEAIYLSGRLISKQSDVYEKRRVIKSTLFIDAKNENVVNEFEPLLALIDFLLSKCTSKQCEVILHKLAGKSEETIANELGISQSAVNQHSTGSGWKAIEKAVNRFNNVIINL